MKAMNGKDQTDFIERLSRAMATQGISKAKLARLTGLSNSSISRFLQGVRRPSVPSVTAMAEALKVSTSYLLGESAHDDVDPDIARFFAEDWAKLSSDERLLLRTTVQMLSNRLRQRDI